MQLTIQAINFSIKSKLKFFIHKRIHKYKHYYGKILSTELYLKLEKSAISRGKYVEIKIKIPGDTLIVKKENNTFENAIDSASVVVERLLIRYKEKQLRSYQNGV